MKRALMVTALVANLGCAQEWEWAGREDPMEMMYRMDQQFQSLQMQRMDQQRRYQQLLDNRRQDQMEMDMRRREREAEQRHWELMRQLRRQ